MHSLCIIRHSSAPSCYALASVEMRTDKGAGRGPEIKSQLLNAGHHHNVPQKTLLLLVVLFTLPRQRLWASVVISFVLAIYVKKNLKKKKLCGYQDNSDCLDFFRPCTRTAEKLLQRDKE